MRGYPNPSQGSDRPACLKKRKRKGRWWGQKTSRLLPTRLLRNRPETNSVGPVPTGRCSRCRPVGTGPAFDADREVNSRQLLTRSQAPAWERLPAKLCFARLVCDSARAEVPHVKSHRLRHEDASKKSVGHPPEKQPPRHLQTAKK